ncbi:CSM3 [Candida metapsilosis]|uniref:Chromosome segregation in meiosis protein n=1 Tax=Candida metapsilosis TaxID=273372 RepID=A0A8H7ZH37_9ASCO|nr:CSM3 [Candida metapsilosis]
MSSNNKEGETQKNDNLLDDPAVLGIDEPLKLKTRRKIAKIDDERLLHTSRGLPYLIKNQQRLLRIIQKNDKEFYKQEKEKLAVQPNYKPSLQLKHDHEYKNLVSILQFYQLWCHGMFPKANFKDCAYLIRSLGHKSSRLRLYRRELIEKEIYKLKVAKGIIDENENGETNEKEPAEGSDTVQVEDEGISELRPTAVTADNDDDDGWDFMNTGTASPTEPQNKQDENGDPSDKINDAIEEDGWDDLEDEEIAAFFGKSNPDPPKVPNNEDEQLEVGDEEEELALEMLRQEEKPQEEASHENETALDAE